uniref:Uncharacterized protein n=1 Tax=Capra hircus TaxID=9925 RepID=A0A8C2P782_CAPHI
MPAIVLYYYTFQGAKMDLVLSIADYYVFTPYIYPATWPEDNIFRQAITLLIVTNLGALILYFFFATLSYYFVYDHLLMKHPQFLKNQVSREIAHSVQSMPWMSIPTVLLFLLEVRGYSRLYDGIGEFPYGAKMDLTLNATEYYLFVLYIYPAT